MERVVIVGAGLYGLVSAKTYLQVKGVYAGEGKTDSAAELETIPSCFAHGGHEVKHEDGCHLLVLDASSDIGGTWAEERLYPNLLSQNSYGLYEFSDLSLADTVPSEQSEGDSQFIPGWKINRYLHAWVAKWGLQKHIKLKSKVNGISRLETKEWSLNVAIADDQNRTGHEKTVKVICDKLILATGLTSVPNLPEMGGSQSPRKESTHVIHAKNIGGWSRTNLGYHPLPRTVAAVKNIQTKKSAAPKVRSVVVYGGAKSSFDLVHFFATLHRKHPSLHLESTPEGHVEVHWIIRENSQGPAWMVPPTSSLPNGEAVASDKAVSTRFIHYLSPCSYEAPKRLFIRNWSVNGDGSWLARLFHGNPFGRWWMRWLWKSIDRSMEEFAQYDADAKMQLLRPNKSIISCGASVGIANQRDLWDTIRSPNVKVYRSTIQSISEPSLNDHESQQGVTVSMTNGENIDDVDLVLHATGYKPIVPIKTMPPSFRLTLGLSGIVSSGLQVDCEDESDHLHNVTEVPHNSTTEEQCQYWKALDSALEPVIKQRLLASGCVLLEDSDTFWSGANKSIPYRLFRRMVAPDLVAKGDRSFATLGVVLGSTIAVIAEVQALWVAAFLNGGFDKSFTCNASCPSKSLYLPSLPKEIMNQEISEDCVLGSLTGSGLEVDAIDYNDMLMRDLGLNPYRLGGGRMQELTGVYEPHVYAGIVEEWCIRRDFLNLSSLA